MHSICIYFLFNKCFEGYSYDPEGKLFNMDYRSFATFSSSFFAQMMILSLLIQNWTVFTFLVQLICGFIDYFPFWRFVYAAKVRDMTILDFFSNPSLYLCYILLIGFCFLTYFIGESFKLFLTKSTRYQIMNIQKQNQELSSGKFTPDFEIANK